MVLDKIATEDEVKFYQASDALEKLLDKMGEIYYVALAPELEVKGKARNIRWKIIENTTVESDL